MVTIQKILSHYKDLNYVVMATVDETKPKLRPITLVKMDESFFFATGADSNKVKQLEMNSEVEILLQWKEVKNNGYIRLEGTVVIEKSLERITNLFNRFEYLNKLWRGAHDPALVVYRVEPKVFDYMKAGAWESVQLEY